MVLKADQERLKTLLKDTITLLCRNGLTFNNEFSIEAVIGITLDRDDVFLVAISEQIQAEKDVTEDPASAAVIDTHDSESETSTSSVVNTKTSESNHVKHRLRIEQCADFSHSDSELAERPTKWQRTELKKPKCEPDDGNNQERCGDPDVTFIKEEINMDFSGEPPSDVIGRSVHDTKGSLISGNMLPANDPVSCALWENTLNKHHRVTGQEHDTLLQQLDNTEVLKQHSNIIEQQIWQNASQQANLSCRFCRKSFYSTSGLQKHENWHNGKYTSYCTVCGKGFMSVSARRGHMVLHTGVREFKCSICGKDYAYKHVMKRHMRRQHGTAGHISRQTSPIPHFE